MAGREAELGHINGQIAYAEASERDRQRQAARDYTAALTRFVTALVRVLNQRSATRLAELTAAEANLQLHVQGQGTDEYNTTRQRRGRSRAKAPAPRGA